MRRVQQLIKCTRGVKKRAADILCKSVEKVATFSLLNDWLNTETSCNEQSLQDFRFHLNCCSQRGHMMELFLFIYIDSL